MSCYIYLVRHGQTIWNETMKYQGHTDIPLSKKGKDQASALSRWLAREKIKAVYASDLKRAYETAKIIAAPHNLDVEMLLALRELNFGVWEGMTSNEIEAAYPELIKQWWDTPLNTQIPDGETIAELAERSTCAVHEVVEKHPEQKVVVVTHGGAIRGIIGKVLDIDLNYYWKLRLDNASLSIIEFIQPKRGILNLFNDCCHLNSGVRD